MFLAHQQVGNQRLVDHYHDPTVFHDQFANPQAYPGYQPPERLTAKERLLTPPAFRDMLLGLARSARG